MSKGYYIYLDQRDVGKGDMLFLGWVNEQDNMVVYNKTPKGTGKNVPVFSIRDSRMVYEHKEMADKTVEMISNMYPEITELLHVELYEEVTFDD